MKMIRIELCELYIVLVYSSKNICSFKIFEMSLNGTMSLEKVNLLSTKEFKDVFSNIIENCPEACDQVIMKRPFSNINEAENAFCDFLHQLHDSEKEYILRKHPELKGKPGNNITAESVHEQKSAGINVITDTERSELITLNQLYKDKFLFPFVICARENNVSSIISEIKARLENSKIAELNNGIEEVKKISKLRIRDLITS